MIDWPYVLGLIVGLVLILFMAYWIYRILKEIIKGLWRILRGKSYSDVSGNAGRS